MVVQVMYTTLFLYSLIYAEFNKKTVLDYKHITYTSYLFHPDACYPPP